MNSSLSAFPKTFAFQSGYFSDARTRTGDNWFGVGKALQFEWLGAREQMTCASLKCIDTITKESMAFELIEGETNGMEFYGKNFFLFSVDVVLDKELHDVLTKDGQANHDDLTYRVHLSAQHTKLPDQSDEKVFSVVLEPTHGLRMLHSGGSGGGRGAP